MQKIEAGKLLTKILFHHQPHPPKDLDRDHSYNEEGSKRMIILSDETIFIKCVEDVLKRQAQKPKTFDGTHALSLYKEYIRQNNLFEPISDCMIHFPDKFNSKKDAIEKSIFSHDRSIFIFGNTSLRNTLNEKDFPNFEIYLSYTPATLERQKCAETLIKFYAPKISHIAMVVEQTLIFYNHDLYQAALHFERMEKNDLGFEEAKLACTNLSSFDIVNTFLEGNIALLDLRLSQYASDGGDCMPVLRTFVYFFTQVGLVHSELLQNNPLNIAFANAKIPYPAQDKIKKALLKIPYSRIEHFFSICACLEVDLRGRQNAYQVLLHELISLNI